MWPMRNERVAESGNAILRIRSGTKAKIYLSIECKKRVQAPNKCNQSESEFGSMLRTSREAVCDNGYDGQSFRWPGGEKNTFVIQNLFVFGQ